MVVMLCFVVLTLHEHKLDQKFHEYFGWRRAEQYYSLLIHNQDLVRLQALRTS